MRKVWIVCACLIWVTSCGNGAHKKQVVKTSSTSSAVTTLEDQSVDFVHPGTPLSMDSVSNLLRPSHGNLHVNANGGFSYEPDPNFFGTDGVSFLFNTGEEWYVAFTVDPANDAPVVVDDIAVTRQNQTLDLNPLVNDHDVEDQSLTLVSIGGAQHGTVTNTVDGITYQPNGDYIGEDVLDYVVSDGELQSSAKIYVLVFGATWFVAQIDINPVDAPVVLGQTLQLTATARMSDGKTVDVTQGANWFSDDPDILDFDNHSAAGLASGKSAGVASVYADFADVSANANITVQGAPPQAPTGITSVPGVESATINWRPVDGAESYNLYVSLDQTRQSVVPHVTAPYVHDHLTAGQSYRYYLTALNAFGESAPSEVAIVTPLVKASAIDLRGTIGATPGQFDIQFNQQTAYRYQLAWSDHPITDVGPDSTVADSISSPLVLTEGFGHGVDYYFLLRAFDAKGALLASTTLSARFASKPPALPVLDRIDAGDQNLTIYFNTTPGLVYHLYWMQGDTFNPAFAQEIHGVNSPHLQSNLLNGVQYQFALKAENDDGLLSDFSMSLGGTPKGAPQTVAAMSTSSVTPVEPTISAGTTVTVTVTARDADGQARNVYGDTPVLIINGANAATITGYQNTQPGVYTLSYSATKAGTDSYTVSLNGQLLTTANTPADKTVQVGALNINSTRVSIPLGPYYQNSSVLFSAALFDSYGNALTGAVQFSVTGVNAETLVTMLNPLTGWYEATFIPANAGDDVIHLNVNSNELTAYASPRTTKINLPPVADAGVDFVVGLNMPARLNGSKSSDPDGPVINYLWELVNAPLGDASTIVSPQSALATFTATIPGVYDFRLTVSDSVVSRTDQVRVTVREGTQVTGTSHAQPTSSWMQTNARGDTLMLWKMYTGYTDGTLFVDTNKFYYAYKPAGGNWGADQELPFDLNDGLTNITPVFNGFIVVGGGSYYQFDGSAWNSLGYFGVLINRVLIAAHARDLMVMVYSSFGSLTVTPGTYNTQTGLWEMNAQSTEIANGSFSDFNLAASNSEYAVVWGHYGGEVDASIAHWDTATSAWVWSTTTPLSSASDYGSVNLQSYQDGFMATWRQRNALNPTQEFTARLYEWDGSASAMAWKPAQSWATNAYVSRASNGAGYALAWVSAGGAYALTCRHNTVTRNCEFGAVQSLGNAAQNVSYSGIASAGADYAAVIVTTTAEIYSNFYDPAKDSWQPSANLIHSGNSYGGIIGGHQQYAVTWTEPNNQLFGSAAQFNTSSGTYQWSTPIPLQNLNTPLNPGAQWAPTANAFQAVWYQFDGERTNIYANEFNAQSAQTPEQLTKSQVNGSAKNIKVVANSGGARIAVWQQVNNGYGYRVLARIHKNNAWGPAFTVAESNDFSLETAGDQFLVTYVSPNPANTATVIQNRLLAAPISPDSGLGAVHEVVPYVNGGLGFKTYAVDNKVSMLWYDATGGMQATVGEYDKTQALWIWPAAPAKLDSAPGFNSVSSTYLAITGNSKAFVGTWLKLDTNVYNRYIATLYFNATSGVWESTMPVNIGAATATLAANANQVLAVYPDATNLNAGLLDLTTSAPAQAVWSNTVLGPKNVNTEPTLLAGPLGFYVGWLPQATMNFRVYNGSSATPGWASLQTLVECAGTNAQPAVSLANGFGVACDKGIFEYRIDNAGAESLTKFPMIFYTVKKLMYHNGSYGVLSTDYATISLIWANAGVVQSTQSLYKTRSADIGLIQDNANYTASWFTAINKLWEPVIMVGLLP